MLPQEFIDKIKAHTNILDLIEEYTPLKKSGDNLYIGSCPHPNHDDSTPSLRVWTKTQSWACMSCHVGKKGNENQGSDVFAFIMWMHNINFRQSVVKLAERINIPLPKENDNDLYEKNRELAIKYTHSVHKVLDYLYARGLDDDDIVEYGIGYTGSRISFPLFDIYLRVLGFSNRIYPHDSQKPKFINSTNSDIFNKSHYLYGIQNLDKDFDEIRITEGTLDVILSNKYGVKNIMATLGTSFTEGHVDIIKHYNKTPVFCMDNDKAGLLSVEKSIELLAKHGIYSKVLILPPEKDMADMALELKNNLEDYIVKNSVTYGHYKIEKIMSQYDSMVGEVKMKLYPEIIKSTQHITHPIERKIIKDHIESKTGIKI